MNYEPDDNHELKFLNKKRGHTDKKVKTGNITSLSLNNFIKDYSPSKAYKLISNRNGVVGIKKVHPHYFVIFYIK